MSLQATTSQTVGPFFKIGFEWLYRDNLAGEGVSGERVSIQGRVLDGDGVTVPDAILERLQRAPTPQAAREEGVAIAREMLIAVRHTVQGAQISAPQGRYNSAVDVLEALGTKSTTV